MENDRRPPDPVASSRLAARETPEEFSTRAARQFFPLHDVRHTLLQHPPPPAPDTDGLDTPFTLPELIAAIESSKKRTTPGPDGIPYEVYQNLEGNILNNILEIINETWTTATIPAEWKHSIVIPLAKPGRPPNRPENLRPISLTPTICKLAERMLATRLSWWLEKHRKYHPAQIGFRPGIGTEDGLAMLAEDSLDVSPHSHATRTILATDISKAYDNLSHDAIVHAMLQLGLPRSVVNCVGAFLNNRTFTIRVEGKPVGQFHSVRGVPQGAVLSPILFNMVYPVSLATRHRAAYALPHLCG